MVTEIITYIIVFIFIGISQSAGIGGGPVINISLMAGLNFSSKESMIFTYIFLVGGSFASMLKNRLAKNPSNGKPLMDYNLIIMTVPIISSGSIIGTTLNHFISDFVITLLFIVLLTYLIFNTWNKYQEVSNQRPSSVVQEFQLGSIEQPLNPQLVAMLEEDKQVYPSNKLLLVLAVLAYTLVILLFKGGQRYQSVIGLQQCGYGSLALILLHLVISLLFSKSMAMNMQNRDRQKQELGYVFKDEYDKMSSKKFKNSLLSGFSAGLIGGTLGLGGAIILVPVWLNIGIDKMVATSSSAPLIFFSAFISIFMSWLGGRYTKYSFLRLILYFVIAFFGSYLVKEFVSYLTEKYRMRTMIFILLLITMSLSLLVLLPYQLIQFLNDPNSFMEFGIFC